jgi:hypothetical protein
VPATDLAATRSLDWEVCRDTKIGLVNRNGEMLAYKDILTSVHDQPVGSFIATLFHEIHGLLNTVNRNVIGIGATFLGWIDEERTGPFLCLNAPGAH